MLERYFDQFDGAASTLTLYRGYVRNHISPFLGNIEVGALDADTLDGTVASAGHEVGQAGLMRRRSAQVPVPRSGFAGFGSRQM
jgi:hypothetical protein